jgi:hypothetical protein
MVAGIVESAFPDHAESLTRGAPENHVDVLFPNLGSSADVVSADVGNTTADYGAIGEIIFMRGGMNRVILDRGGDAKSGLLESQRQAARSSEEIYANRPLPIPLHRTHALVNVLSPRGRDCKYESNRSGRPIMQGNPSARLGIKQV